MYFCTLTPRDRPACDRPAVVEIEHGEGGHGWGCTIHALAALRADDRARIVRDLTTTMREVNPDANR